MMNENSRLSPSKIIEQSNSAIRKIEGENELLRASIVAMEQFINDRTSNTRGIRNLRLKMEDYRRAVNGLIKANNADILDYKKLNHMVGTLELNGEVILRNQSERRETIRDTEAQLEHYRGLGFSWWQHLLKPEWVIVENSRRQSLILRYEDRLRNAQAALAIWEERERTYNEIEQGTKELFTTGRAMREEAKPGIEYIRDATAGLPASFQSTSLARWRSDLQVKKEVTTTRKGQAQEVLERLESQSALVYGRFRISDEIIFPLWDASIYDHGFPFDPDLVATREDHRYWNLFELLMKGAGSPAWLRQWADELGFIDRVVPGGEGIERNFEGFTEGSLRDAIAVFHHYRNGRGADFFLDLTRAYEQDDVMRADFHFEVHSMQEAVENLRNQTGLTEFIVSSDTRGNLRYPATQNWMKVIGGYQVWSHAEVNYVDGEFQMIVTVHTLDRYNFNPNDLAVASLVPDELNGRFEQLGWAHSFNTFGEITFEVSWREGESHLSEPVMQSGGGR